MVPDKVVKAKVKVKAKPYYKLYDDAPTKADKKREAEMAADLMKEDFYGKKKKEEKRGDYLTKTSKTVKEDMKVPPFMDRIGRDAINARIVEERTKQTREALKKNPKGVIFRSVEIKKK